MCFNVLKYFQLYLLNYTLIGDGVTSDEPHPISELLRHVSGRNDVIHTITFSLNVFKSESASQTF